MKKNSLLKLLVLTLAAAMLLSMFVACDNTEDPTETPTDAPTEAPTDAPTEAPTAAPTEEATTEAPTEEATTEAPTEEATTEAPTEEATTEAPTEEATTEEATTEAPTEEATTEEATTEAPTEAETEYAPAIESEIKDDYTYIISMTQENVDGKILYLNGEMDGYYMATTEDFNAAIVVRAAATEGGFNLFYYVDTAKVYINIIEKVDGEKTYYNAVYSDEAVSVWTYDATLGTIVTKVGEKTFYLGTYNEFTTFSATDAEKYPDNFKATLRVPEKCVHAYAYSEEGHWKIACARCEKAAGSVKEHYYIEHTVNGDVLVEACTVCGYVIPIPDSIQYMLNDTMIKGSKTPNFQFTITNGEEDDVKYIRYSGSAKSATHAAQSIWVGKSWGGERINAGNSKYLAIKMRGTGDLAANTFRFYLGASGNAAELGGIGIRFDLSNMITAGEWTWIIIDLEKSLVREDGTDVWVADAEGNYMIDHMYFHTQPHAEDCHYDFATMAFVSDWSGIEYVMGGDAEYKYVAAGKLNTVTEADAVTTFNGAVLEAEGVVKGYKLKHTVNEDMTITWDPDDDVGQYILTRTSPVINANFKLLSSNTKYLVIKVKKTDKEDADVQPSDFAVGLSSFGHTNNPSINLGTVIGTDWTTLVVDLATIPGFLDAGLKEAYTGDTGEFEGKTALRQLQVTMNSTTAVYDVAFFAFVDDWAPIASLAGSEKAYFTGKSTENSNATDPVAVNAKDGSEWVEPAVVLDADFFTKHTPRVDWALSATVAEDGATRFTSTAGTAAEQAIIQVGRGDAGWTDASINVATAKFLVVKIKASRDIAAWMYLGTGNGVDKAAGQKTIYFNLTTDYVTYVVNLEELNSDWVAVDGSYIIDKLSYVINFEAADKDTNYVDVAYTAFATTWAQVAELVDVNAVKYASDLGTGTKVPMTTKDQPIDTDPTKVDPNANTIITFDAAKINASTQLKYQSSTAVNGDVFSFAGTTAEASAAQVILADKWRAGAYDVKDSTYLIFTAKTTGTPDSFRFGFSTSATDPQSYEADDAQFWVVLEGGASAEWTTYVVDLVAYTEQRGNLWAAKDGKYVIDRFVLDMTGASTATTTEIKSIVFTNSWAGVDEVLEAETVKEIVTKVIPGVDGAADTVSQEVIDTTIADKVAAEQAPEA